MALADVFHALISKRIYKDRLSFDAARNVIAGERARKFDPDVPNAVLAGFDELRAVAERHSDSEASLTAKPWERQADAKGPLVILALARLLRSRSRHAPPACCGSTTSFYPPCQASGWRE
jgi:hypothetical protein